MDRVNTDDVLDVMESGMQDFISSWRWLLLHDFAQGKDRQRHYFVPVEPVEAPDTSLIWNRPRVY